MQRAAEDLKEEIASFGTTTAPYLEISLSQRAPVTVVTRIKINSLLASLVHGHASAALRQDLLLEAATLQTVRSLRGSDRSRPKSVAYSSGANASKRPFTSTARRNDSLRRSARGSIIEVTRNASIVALGSQ